MKIIFFGSSHFALPSLKALLEAGYDISLVVTQPDKEQGRGMDIHATPIKEFAQKHNLKIYQPDNVNFPESIKLLKETTPQLFIVIAYGQILSEEILNIPEIMPINIHGSILPYYRGASPINRAIINADPETGVTLIKMTPKMDAGPILSIKTIKINPDDDFIKLEEKLSALGAGALLETIETIKNKTYALIPQNENKVTFAPKLKKEDGLIDWSKEAGEINNLIKGCLGWPDAFTYLDGKLLKIFKANVILRPPLGEPKNLNCANAVPGQIIEASKNGIIVACKEGCLEIKELQLEGKKRLSAQEFLLGHKTKGILSSLRT